MGQRIVEAVALRLIVLVRFREQGRWVRDGAERVARGERFPLGVGAWRTHMTRDFFAGMSLCGQPVDHMGGPGVDASCRRCQRIWARGRRAAS